MVAMTGLPEYQLRGEIRRIVRRESGLCEVLLLVRGRTYDPDDPRTFLHLTVVDRLRRTVLRHLRVGDEVVGTVIMTARFLEESPRPHRSLEVDRRPMSGRLPKALRNVAYDTRVTGQVVSVVDDETFVLDAGIPLLVRVPGAEPGLPPEGEFVEFLLHEVPVAEFL